MTNLHDYSDLPAVMTAEKAAEIVDCQVCAIWQHIQDGDLKAKKVGKRWIILRHSFLEWLGHDRKQFTYAEATRLVGKWVRSLTALENVPKGTTGQITASEESPDGTAEIIVGWGVIPWEGSQKCNFDKAEFEQYLELVPDDEPLFRLGVQEPDAGGEEAGR